MDNTTTLEWVNASILIMNTSMEIGAKIYPLICGLGLIRLIIESV